MRLMRGIFKTKSKALPYQVEKRVFGKKITQSFSTLDAAQAFAKRIDLERDCQIAGISLPKEEIQFRDFATEFLIARDRDPDLSNSQKHNDERGLRLHILPKIGHLPLSLISRAVVQKMLNDLGAEGMSPVMRNRVRTIVSVMFNRALAEEKYRVLNDSSPVTHVPVLSEKLLQRQTSFWESDEHVEAYIQAAYRENPNYGLFAVLQLFAGPRICETMALRNGNVSTERDELRFQWMYERCTHEIIRQLKGEGKGGHQTKPLFPRVKQAILDHWEFHSRHKGADDFLLHRRDGSFIPYGTLSHAHARICRIAGVPKITVHDMRRTCGVQMEAAGHVRSDVKVQLGHKSVVTTERYLPDNPDSVKRRAKRTGFGQTILTPLRLLLPPATDQSVSSPSVEGVSHVSPDRAIQSPERSSELALSSEGL